MVEERERDAHSEAEHARAQIHELKSRVTHTEAEVELRVAEERAKMEALELRVETERTESRQREAELTQQLQHWEQHLRSTLVDFLREDSLSPMSAGVLAGSATGRSKEA